MIHYIMVNKPWHYDNCPYSEYFWEYARETEVYEELRSVLVSYTDEDKARDAESARRLVALAVSETEREDNFLNRLNKEKRAKDRVEILYKIEQYEKEGRFDEDVENDPPGRVLMPDEIEYVRKTKAEKMKTKFAFKMAHKFVDGLIADKKLIIKEIKGLENIKNLNSGAVMTCNHFNAFDSFAIQLAYEAAEQPHRSFWRVIREGNYTSFPGFYGFLMRHCNTLPLSSNLDTMKKFFSAIDELLETGDYVLFYPEQSMWWNYRKPKPLKRGAFLCAARSNAPVLPCFITMQDSDVVGEDGFYVQEYTIHISPPIFPKEGLTRRQQAEYMMKRTTSCGKRYTKQYITSLSPTPHRTTWNSSKALSDANNTDNINAPLLCSGALLLFTPFHPAARRIPSRSIRCCAPAGSCIPPRPVPHRESSFRRTDRSRDRACHPLSRLLWPKASLETYPATRICGLRSSPASSPD